MQRACAFQALLSALPHGSPVLEAPVRLGAARTRDPCPPGPSVWYLARCWLWLWGPCIKRRTLVGRSLRPSTRSGVPVSPGWAVRLESWLSSASRLRGPLLPSWDSTVSQSHILFCIWMTEGERGGEEHRGDLGSGQTWPWKSLLSLPSAETQSHGPASHEGFWRMDAAVCQGRRVDPWQSPLYLQ